MEQENTYPDDIYYNDEKLDVQEMRNDMIEVDLIQDLRLAKDNLPLSKVFQIISSVYGEDIDYLISHA